MWVAVWEEWAVLGGCVHDACADMGTHVYIRGTHVSRVQIYQGCVCVHTTNVAYFLRLQQGRWRCNSGLFGNWLWRL